MNSKRTLGIAARLVAVLAVMVLGMAGLATYTWVELHEVAELASKAEHSRVPQLHDIAAVELNITRSSLQLRHAMLARTPEEQKAALDDIAAKRALIDEALKDYETRLHNAEGRQRFAPVPDLVRNFWTVGEANVALIRAGNKEEAFAFLVDKTIPARNALLQVLDDTVNYQTTHLSHDIEDIRASVNTTLLVLIGVFAVFGISLAAFAWWLRRTLLRRVGAAQQVAERVRDGDLTGTVHDDARDELSPLLAALAQMQDSLVRVVSTVRHGADGVATASNEIAQGNHDLSTRTEEQAGALQETAATMGQLGSTVQHNASNAVEASRLASDAARVASEGGNLMNQVVTTMEGISDASRRIGDIISVIDGIAFQTNILALNAAVEAARAGENGRGFAVVAGEVRSLAVRSAEAAREVKTLIGTSVERVGQGAGLVTNAGQTMTAIVSSIDRVNAIMSEISEASQEQSRGVTEVGRAIEQMDNATQQNAALVEQSAAAAESMRQQAQQLVGSVASFRLAG